MKIVEVFKTNVIHAADARELINSLREIMPQCKINFDLDDCDHILRIESFSEVDVLLVSNHLSGSGYFAEVLE